MGPLARVPLASAIAGAHGGSAHALNGRLGADVWIELPIE